MSNRRDEGMSRQRMIRPEFFTDEDLTELDPLTRLLFVGLWTLADREGRLKDRPKGIKLAIFPADKCDVDAMLDDLNEVGSIRRYEVDGQHCIDIPGFTTHQRIHPGEAASVLPPFMFHRNSKKLPVRGENAERLSSAGKLHGEQRSLDVDVSLREVSSAGECSLQEEPSSLIAFDDFWSVYPNKNGRNDARKKWHRLGADDRRKAFEVAEKMALVVSSGKKERKFCPGGIVFVNQRRWDDWEDGPPAGYEMGDQVGKQRSQYQDIGMTPPQWRYCDTNELVAV